MAQPHWYASINGMGKNGNADFIRGTLQHRHPKRFETCGAKQPAFLLTLLLALVWVAGTPLTAQEADTLRARVPADERHVTNPASVPAGKANFLKDGDMVVGIALEGAAKAYWLPMVIWDHRISDRVGPIAVLISWCSLCNTGLVFRPEMDGRALTFTVPGLRGGNLVLKDDQTGSLWQQATGEAFQGPLKGKRLPLVPFQITSWGAWRALHPGTLAAAPDPRDEAGYRSMDQSLNEPFWEMQPAPLALRQDPRLPPHTMILGVEAAGSSSAYPIETVKDERIINDQVGPWPVLIIYTPSTDTARAFSRRMGERILKFRLTKSSAMSDLETGSEWDSDGRCVSGKLKGEKLDPLILEPGYWFAWAEFHPETAVFSPASE